MSNFANFRQIWKHSRGFSRLKLAVAQASITRPALRPLCRAFLRLMARSGMFWATCDTGYGEVRSSFRLSQLESDVQGFLEVAIGDCYHLPQEFAPDLILDGGGNTGLFTINALRRWPSARAIIFEPVPDNIDRIQAHLKANGLQAELEPLCLGAAPGTMKFYCREANQGSFSDDLPYNREMDVQVTSLRPYLPTDPATKCLIKLDIEGAELSVTPDIVGALSENTIVVGELHQREVNQQHFKEEIIGANRQIEFFDEGTCAMFHIQSRNASFH